MNQYLMIGEILKPQGIKGEAKIKPYASDLSSFLTWKTLYFCNSSNYVPVSVLSARVNDGFAYVRLEGCSSPDDVEKIRSKQLFIDREHAFPLDEGTVYIADMIGVTIVDEKGNNIGVLKDVLQNGSVDIYVFSTKQGTMMAPALKSVFPVLNLESKTMTVDTVRLREVAVFEN